MPEIEYENDAIMHFGFLDNSNVKDHLHKNIELIYVLEGEFALKIEGRESTIKKDDILMINPNTNHGYRKKKEGLIGFVQINHDEIYRYIDLGQIRFQCDSRVENKDTYDKIRSVLWQIFNQYPLNSGSNLIFLNSLYFSLLNHLFNFFTVKADGNQSDIKRDDLDRRHKIMNYLQINYKKPIGLEDLSQKVYLSNAYLSKYIKAKFGSNFIDILTNIRLSHTLGDLIKSEKSITYIALDNGFSSVAAFSRALKAAYNMTPKMYIQRYKTGKTAKPTQNHENTSMLEKKVMDYLGGNNPWGKRDGKKASRTLSLDMKKMREYKKSWNRMINIGSVCQLARIEVRNHILLMKDELGFEYIRFWDIYSSDLYMNIDPHDSDYNFDRIDRIMDFIVKNDMHPYVELGFKDILLIKNPKEVIKQEKRQILFQNKAEYGRFLKNLLYHYSTRYGIKEIENWYFEQWCDPRLINTKNAIEYFEWFEEAYRTIKKFSKNIRVGGAGLGRYMHNGQDHESFFRIWKSRESHPDFISVYSYSYQPSRNRGDEFESQQSQDTIHTYNLINSVKEALAKSGLCVSELHITEWNATISDRNCINDSCYQASFVVKNIIENFSAIEFMGYWLGSDLLSEYLDSRPLLVGGSGLLTKDGIKKPSYHAFSFMQRLHSYLLGSDENSIVTTDGRDSFMIVCHNYKYPSFKYYLKPEDQIQPDQLYQLFENDEIIGIHIKIDNVMKGIYTVKNYSLSRKSGSVQDEWMQMGKPKNMDQIDIAYLERICIPRIHFEQIETDDDTLDFTTTLLPHEIRQIHIQYKGPGK